MTFINNKRVTGDIYGNINKEVFYNDVHLNNRIGTRKLVTNIKHHLGLRGRNVESIISDEEFETAICKLKANKAPGIDNILKEVLKVGKDFIKIHLITLFNRILSTGKYPLLWSFGLIVPVHKKDDPSKAEN